MIFAFPSSISAKLKLALLSETVVSFITLSQLSGFCPNPCKYKYFIYFLPSSFFLFFFIRSAAFPVLQSDTGACLCSFCRTRWLLWGNSRCTPCSGCSFCPRPAFRFPDGCCSEGTTPRTYRSRCRHPLPGRHPLLQKSDRTPGSPGRS